MWVFLVKMSDLCQTEQNCIACCMGTYLDAPKSELEAIFDKRAKVMQEADGRKDYAKRIAKIEQDVPFCEFVGYVGDGVGCTIHPANTEGEDLRVELARCNSLGDRFKCKSDKIFDQAEKDIKEIMLEAVRGMCWYHFSHFVRMNN